jgi:beta-lactamase superfamily II metal-dependent hydrolase
MPTHFAAFPAPVLFTNPVGTEAQTQLLWGDEVTITGPAQNGRVPVTAYTYTGWMNPDDLQLDRLLEITFVDIGQGDGSVLVMPDDRKLVIDAGEGDNMYRFLRWKFGKLENNRRTFHQDIRFDAFIISHSDKDHYGGFQRLVNEPRLFADRGFHNGRVERAGTNEANMLGPQVPITGGHIVSELISDTAALTALLNTPGAVGGKLYPKLLKSALDSGRFPNWSSLSAARNPGQRAFVPGYEADKPVSIEVLGPVIETIEGKTGLRWFGSKSKAAMTKNGHSVVLRLRYREVSVLLGGDLNIPAEHLLLSHHTGRPSPPATADAEEALVFEARQVFQCDFAKACHHGSADFTDLYLRAVNPMATIISSGDEEDYAHPRADTLGAVGRCSRGTRPLIFSTELARSSSERIKNPNQFRTELLELVKQIVDRGAAGDAPGVAQARERLEKKFLDIDRSVATYGAINLRTDGTRAVMAYKIERPTKNSKKWDIYRFEPGPDGRLTYTSKHEE